MPGQKVTADVKHSLPEVAKAEELKLADTICAPASPAKSKEIWVERKNVPMSASKHGCVDCVRAIASSLTRLHVLADEEHSHTLHVAGISHIASSRYAASTAKLEDRLSALGNPRLNWTACYEDAVKTWQSAQDHDGAMYDIGHQLTPIESRVGSLSKGSACVQCNLWPRLR